MKELSRAYLLPDLEPVEEPRVNLFPFFALVGLGVFCGIGLGALVIIWVTG